MDRDSYQHPEGRAYKQTEANFKPKSSQQGMGISNAVGLAAAEAHLAAAYNKRLGRELRVGDDGE